MKPQNSILLFIIIFLLNGCIAKSEKVKLYNMETTNSKKSIYGKASYYAKSFNGGKTASGEVYNMYANTAAHRTLPFNTMVKVTDMLTKKSSIVRINDRGPFSKDRVIDLSYASAKKLGIINRGVANVKIEVLGKKIHSNIALPVSTQFCVGDSCRASFATSKTEVKEAHSSSTAIQVGAFRRYAGAKIYANRYGMLSNKYKTVIKNGLKDNRPIYRVQIEGFLNDNEANAFIAKYSILNGSFLVSR